MPENRGNATAYVAGQGHIPLPHADHQHTYRAAHQTQDPKPVSTFDWDWNKATCTSCQTKTLKATLVDGACHTCRGVEPGRAIRAQPTPLEHSRDGSQVYVPYDDKEIAERFQAPAVAPAEPELEPDPDTVVLEDTTPDTATDTATDTAADNPAPEIESPQVNDTAEQPSSDLPNRQPADPQPLTSADLLHHQLDHTTRTLTRAHRSTDPVAGMLRTAALSAIAALDVYLELHHPTQAPVASTAGPADATGHTTQPALTGLGRARPAAAPQGEGGPQQPAKFQTYQRTRMSSVKVDEQQVITDYLAGDTPPAIARRLGLPQADRVRRILARHNVPLRDDRGRVPNPHGNPATTVNRRLTDLGVTTRHVKDWAVSVGILTKIARGSVAHTVIDAYETAHQQEGQPA